MRSSTSGLSALGGTSGSTPWGVTACAMIPQLPRAIGSTTGGVTRCGGVLPRGAIFRAAWLHLYGFQRRRQGKRGELCPSRRPARRSGQRLAHDPPSHVSQPLGAAGVGVGELLVVQPQAVQDGGVEVVDA